MDTKEHFLTTGAVTYLWVMGISFWGGIVSYFEKHEPFCWKKLFAHLSSASFAGLMTFYLCQYGDIPAPLTGVFCGVAAHMGTPALMKLRIIRRFLEGQMDIDEKEKK